MLELDSLRTLRPRSIAELADQIVNFFRIAFLPLIAMSFVFGLIPLVLTMGLSLMPTLGMVASDFIGEDAAALAMASSLFGSCFSQIAQIVTVYFLYPLQIAAVAVAIRSYLLEGTRPTWRSLLGTMRNSWQKIAGLGIVYLIVSVLALLAFLFPPLGIAVSILLSISFYLAACIVPLEGLGPLEAIKRGWNLAANGRWRIFAFYIVYFFFSLIISGSLAGLGALIGYFTAEATGALAALFGTVLLGSTVAGALSMPVLFAAVPFIYFDLRSRHEGLDLALAAAQARGQPLDLAMAPTIQRDLLSGESGRALGQLTLLSLGLIVLLILFIFLLIFLLG